MVGSRKVEWLDRSGLRKSGQEQSRAEAAYRRLKDAILAGELEPGRRLREVDLAAWLGISRTPIREALRRLEADGLLIVVPRRGLTIAKLDHQAIIELYMLREVLEGAAARFAAQHASDVEIANLRELLEEERASNGTSPVLASYNRQFHAAIYRASHNRYVISALLGLRDSMALLGRTTLSLPGRADEARDEHRALIDAIAAREPERAEQAARLHIRNAQRARLKILSSELLDPPP